MTESWLANSLDRHANVGVHCDPRQRLLELVDAHLANLDTVAPARAKRIRGYMEKPCFRNCGLIVAGDAFREVTDALEWSDPYLHITNKDSLFYGDGADIDPEGYYKVYTDGSAIDTQTCTLLGQRGGYTSGTTPS